MLGEYTLKVIIAVICILFLFYLLFRLYSSYQDKKNLDMAEASLRELVEKINEAKEKGNSEVILLNPEGWWVIAWPYKNENKKPNQCLGNYCICICDIGLGRTSSLEKCNSRGICNDFNEKITTGDSPIPIKDPPVSLNIKNEGGELIITKK